MSETRDKHGSLMEMVGIEFCPRCGDAVIMMKNLAHSEYAICGACLCGGFVFYRELVNYISGPDGDSDFVIRSFVEVVKV